MIFHPFVYTRYVPEAHGACGIGPHIREVRQEVSTLLTRREPETTGFSPPFFARDTGSAYDLDSTPSVVEGTIMLTPGQRHRSRAEEALCAPYALSSASSQCGAVASRYPLVGDPQRQGAFALHTWKISRNSARQHPTRTSRRQDVQSESRSAQDDR
jgi:hypothetical protein